jgi:predicted metal-dependent hydrolase
VLQQGQAVGKGHHLRFIAKASADKVTSRVSAIEITVSYPATYDPSNPEVQKVAREACIRSLRLQAEQLLPQRLATLAERHGFTYSKVSVKRLKSRWGSCDQQAHIVLNLFLMQLPWNMIDYVLLHELTHTRILRHGPDFWQAMQAVSPQSSQQRQQLRDYQPVLTID